MKDSNIIYEFKLNYRIIVIKFIILVGVQEQKRYIEYWFRIEDLEMSLWSLINLIVYKVIKNIYQRKIFLNKMVFSKLNSYNLKNEFRNYVVFIKIDL